MEVARYTFQSPYSSPIQVGRPDPSVKKEESSTNESLPDETQQKAKQFAATQVSDVKPVVDTQQLLDTYA